MDPAVLVRSPKGLLFLQRSAGNRAVQRLIVQRTLADVDSKSLSDLGEALRTVLDASLEDGPQKPACVDLGTKVLQTMAERVIDISTDSGSLCSNFEAFLPDRLKKILPQSTESLEAFASALRGFLRHDSPRDDRDRAR